MDILAEKRMMVIRYTPFKKFDFIEEHAKLIAQQQSVWMLKIGRKIPETAITKIIDEGGNVVLKAPKSAGGDFYLAHCCASHQGRRLKNMVFPEYYLFIDGDFDRDPLDGTWLKIDRLESLSEHYSDRLYLCSNGKKLNDIISTTRTSVLYVYYSENE